MNAQFHSLKHISALDLRSLA